MEKEDINTKMYRLPYRLLYTRETLIIFALLLIFLLFVVSGLIQKEVASNLFSYISLLYLVIALYIVFFRWGLPQDLVKWALENVKCPACGGKIKNFELFKQFSTIYTAQCGECNRKFFFDYVGGRGAFLFGHYLVFKGEVKEDKKTKQT